MNKTLKVMTSAALLAGVVAPVVASADTDARVSNVVTLSDKAENKATGVIILKEFEDYTTDLKAGGQFVITFPEGVEVKNDENNIVTLNGHNINGLADGVVEIVGTRTVNVTLPNNTEITNARDTIEITPIVDVTSDFSGSTLDVVIDDLGAGVKAGTFTVAKVLKGSTTAVALDTKTIGGDGQLGEIRITENALGTLEAGDKITLKLPAGFKFKNTTVVKGLGGLANATFTPDGWGEQKVTLIIGGAIDNSKLGIIQITPDVEVDTDDAKYGDIVIDLSGDVTAESIKVGTYADYTVEVKADGDAKELVAGRYDAADQTAEELQTLVIKEKIADSFVNRKVKVELPEGVHVVGIKVDGNNALNWTAKGKTYVYDTTDSRLENGGTPISDDVPGGIKVDKNVVEFTQPYQPAGATELKLKFYVSVKADFTGDVVAKVTGTGVEGEALLGKVVAPLTVEAESKNVEIGLRNQEVGSIILTESKREALKKGKTVTVKFEDYAVWAEKPTVEVLEGDIEIKDVKLVDSDRTVEFTVKSDSTKPSKIKISGGKINLDRTTPEGDLKVAVSGSYIENADTDGTVNHKQINFDKGDLGKYTIAKVVTPAPGKATASEVQFTVGSTTYTVDGVEKTMDVAPFIEGGRTYLPIRYVAEAVGVAADSIYWDQATQTATLIKGDRVVQLTAGKNVIKINGAEITIDAAAQVKDGRTVLPIRAVGTALGAKVDWNQADNTVTVK